MEVISKKKYNDSVDFFRKVMTNAVQEAFNEDGRVDLNIVALKLQGDDVRGMGLEPINQMISEFGKEVASEFAKNAIQKLEPLAVAFMSESWMVARKTAEEVNNIRPSQEEDRQEVVILNIETHDTRCNYMWKINREGEKPILELETEIVWEKKDPAKLGGNFDNLLSECYVAFEEAETTNA